MLDQLKVELLAERGSTRAQARQSCSVGCTHDIQFAHRRGVLVGNVARAATAAGGGADSRTHRVERVSCGGYRRFRFEYSCVLSYVFIICLM